MPPPSRISALMVSLIVILVPWNLINFFFHGWNSLLKWRICLLCSWIGHCYLCILWFAQKYFQLSLVFQWSNIITNSPRVCCIQTVSWKCQSLSDTVGHPCTSYSHQDTRALSVSLVLDCLSSCAVGAWRCHSKLLSRSYLKISI